MLAQTYEVGKYAISGSTAIWLEAWFSAFRDQYVSFDEFLRFKMEEALKDYMDKPSYSKFILDYQMKEGHTRELKIPTKLYDELEAEAKKKELTPERFVEKLIEDHAF